MSTWLHQCGEAKHLVVAKISAFTVKVTNGGGHMGEHGTRRRIRQACGPWTKSSWPTPIPAPSFCTACLATKKKWPTKSFTVPNRKPHVDRHDGDGCPTWSHLRCANFDTQPDTGTAVHYRVKVAKGLSRYLYFVLLLLDIKSAHMQLTSISKNHCSYP
jgi:hypothetical protein